MGRTKKWMILDEKKCQNAEKRTLQYIKIQRGGKKIWTRKKPGQEHKRIQTRKETGQEQKKTPECVTREKEKKTTIQNDYSEVTTIWVGIGQK